MHVLCFFCKILESICIKNLLPLWKTVKPISLSINHVLVKLFLIELKRNYCIFFHCIYGTTTDEVAGDIDIDIKLNKPGTFRLNLFSHSADQYTSFLDNSQRNGVGVAYQREFNNLGQFFRDLFTPRREREEREAAQPADRIILQIDTAGKAHPLIPNE